MLRTRKILVTLGITVGAVGLGAAVSAAVDGSGAETDGPTTTTSTSTTTTTTTTTTSVPTTTIELPDGTDPDPTSPDETVPGSDVPETPDDVPAPESSADDGEESTDAGGPPDAALFGQCTAFAGRPQPGDSEAWQRLYERAGGDIEGFCAPIVGDHPGRGHGAGPAADPPRSAPGRSGDSDGPPGPPGPPGASRGGPRG